MAGEQKHWMLWIAMGRLIWLVEKAGVLSLAMTGVVKWNSSHSATETRYT